MKEQFAFCDKVALRASNECAIGDGAHNLLIDSAQCGYLGAIYDHAFRGLYRPQNPKAPLPPPNGQSGAATAFAEANVIVDISATVTRTP